MFTSKREKPKGKSAQLQLEEPTNGVYSKKCGLYTTRPLKWAEALEILTENNSGDPCRWDYICDDEAYTECAVKIFQLGSTNKKTVIEIKMITGVIFIYGTNHQEWISSNFGSWKKIVETGEYDCPTPHVSDEADETKHKEDQENELSQLWAQQTILKTSITTIENSISDLRNDIQTLTETVARHHSSNEAATENINTICDQKMMGILAAADDTIDGKIRKCKLEMTKELEKQTTQVSKQEARFQSSIEQLRNTLSNLKPTDANLPKWTDLENLSGSCTSANESTMMEVDTLKDRMDSVQLRVDSLVEVNSSSESNSTLPRLENEIKILQHNVSVMKKQIEKEPQQRAENAVPYPVQEHSSGNTVATSCPTSTVSSALPLQSAEHLAVTQEKKLVVLADSNGERLNREKFCLPISLEDTVWETCYRLPAVNSTLDSMRNVKIDMLVISCGVNDTDLQSGQDVAREMVKTVQRIRAEHPHTKIVISEATPRKIRKDDRVQTCNRMLHEQLENMPNVVVASQSNLRDNNFVLLEDDKHVKRSRINVFAGNLKAAMRQVRYRNRNNNNNINNNNNNNNNYHDNNSNISNNNYSINNNNANSYNSSYSLNNSGFTHHQTPPSMFHTPSSLNAQPLMAFPVPPPVQHLNTGPNGSHHPRFPPGNPPAPPLVRPHMTSKVTTPIGDRLLQISKGTDNSRENNIRDTLIDKLGDVIKCLQVW